MFLLTVTFKKIRATQKHKLRTFAIFCKDRVTLEEVKSL